MNDITVMRVLANQNVWVTWTLTGVVMGVTTVLTEVHHLQEVVLLLGLGI